MRSDWKKWLVPALLAAAFAARVGYGLAFPSVLDDGRVADHDHYYELARSVADSWSLRLDDGSPSAMREPFYPVVLGLGVKLLGERYASVLLVNAALGTAMLGLLFLVGRRLLGERAALLALAVGAFYPHFLYHAAQAQRETALCFAGVLAVWALLEASRRGTPAAFAGAGAANALAGLANTTFLPFGLILAPASFFYLYRGRWKQALRFAAVYLGLFMLLYAAWPLRNYAVFGQFVFGSTAGAGGTFYTYLIVPQEAGGTPEQTRIIETDPVSQEAGKLEPVEREKFLMKAGMRWVREHPLSYIRLVAWRFFIDHWRILPRARPYSHSRRSLVWVSLLSDGWILPLALAGLLLVRLKPPEMLWAYLLVFSTAGVYSLILTMLRYRLPAMPWAILLAAYAAVRAWERLTAPRRTGG